ncbi:MAG: pantetheine-phosphate adenylyltransferase, partial [Flavicella sp.]
MRRAVFPGSFDPITLGHVDIINRAIPLFDEIVIAIGVNSDKKYMFSLEKRISFIEKIFENKEKIKVTSYSGLTVDYCKKVAAPFILRGLRNPADFEFEKA